MHTLGMLAQIVIALGIFNVWLIRFKRPTEFRGGSAQNMREEFAAYGMPAAMMWIIGGLKITLAVALVAGIWWHALVRPAAIGMGVLMVGAIAMHLKVRDPATRSLPAAGMLALSMVAALA